MAPTVPLYAFQLPTPLLADFQPRQLTIPESHPLHPSNRQSPATATQPVGTPSPTPQQLAITGGQYTCQLTGASFADLGSLRDHYRTDWYKYNVKLKLQGKPTPVSEEQFNQLVEGLSESISGSGSSSSDQDEDSEGASSSSSTNAVSRLLKKQRIDSAQVDKDGDDAEDALRDALNDGGARSALVWFEAPSVNPGTQYGLYRASFPVAGATSKKRAAAGEGNEVLQELRGLQLPESVSKGAGKKAIADAPDGSATEKERKWTLLMFGGGHFAGMVVSLVPRLVSRGKGKEKEKEVVILEKKTFHRYTTRRKQGGAQSANDNGKGKAKSAGAQIRRYNEATLIDEVRDLLNGWREQIDDSELIFLRCSKNNYKTFFGYEDAVLDRKDQRIRGFSFPTRRPTINELIRSFTELTRVKTSHLSAEALAQLDVDYLASVAKAAPKPKPVQQLSGAAKAPAITAPRLTREQEVERDRWLRCVDMTRKGKVEALAAFLDKYGPELELEQSQESVWGSLPGWMEEAKTMPTLLHIASAADQSEMVTWLLKEKKADPTLHAPSPVKSDLAPATPVTASRLAITNGADAGESDSPTAQTPAAPRPAQTPYELAPSRATRNAFRLIMSQHPDWWDWSGTGLGGARVPSALNEDKESEREAKKNERRALMREKLKERDAGRAEKERVEREEAERLQADKAKKEADELRRRGGTAVSSSGPKRLGGGPPMGMVKQQQAAAGLTEAQKMRVEREQRARAAEARLAKMAGGGGGA